MTHEELEATFTHLRYSADLLHKRSIAARAGQPIDSESLQESNAWRWLRLSIEKLSEHCLPQEEQKS